MIRDNNITRGRDEARFPHGSCTYQSNFRCYVCNKSGHKAFNCPDKSRHNHKRENSKPPERERDTKPKKTNLAQLMGECVRLRGKVNGIECSVIPGQKLS